MNVNFVSRCSSCHKKFHHTELQGTINCPHCGNVQLLNNVRGDAAYEGELKQLSLPWGD